MFDCADREDGVSEGSGISGGSRDMRPSADGGYRGLHSALSDLVEVDDLSQEVFRTFLRTLHLHRRLMIQTVAESHAHPAQTLCLLRLAADEGVTQTTLADDMFLASPTVSRMLKTMEEAGLVERRADADDQRVARVYLTELGRRRERQLRAVTAAHVNETFGALSRSDKEELARLLGELCGLVEAAIKRREGEAP